MHKKNMKEDFINDMYEQYHYFGLVEGTFEILTFVENTITDKMVKLIQELAVELELVDLYLFSLTSNIIDDYNENIGRLDYKDYVNQIDTLKNIADDLQYYAQTQISIDLPSFPLQPAHLIYLFINHIESKYPKSVYTDFLSYFGKKQKGSLNEKIHTAIKQYTPKETYEPNIKLSHTHILLHTNASSIKSPVNKNLECLEEFFKIIERKRDNIKKNMHTYKFYINDTNYIPTVSLKTDKSSDIFTKESIHYAELNTGNDILNSLKNTITCEIYDYLVDYNIINKLDPYSIWLFAEAVYNHKFMIKGTVNHSNGTKFRKQINKLKSNADLILPLSKYMIFIHLPLFRNENIDLLAHHLEERGLNSHTQETLLSFFLLQEEIDEGKVKIYYKQAPRTNNYLLKVKSSLKESSYYLHDLKLQGIHSIKKLSKDEHLLNKIEELGIAYRARNNTRKEKRKGIQSKLIPIHKYNQRIHALLDIYEHGINTEPSASRLDFLKSFIPAGKVMVLL